MLTDEIYEYFVYDGRRHVSPGSFAEIADRTITISGYSKTYSITGWRIGFCSSRWAERIGHLNDLIYICAPAPLQAGVAAGIAAVSPEYYAELQRAFDRKRARISDALHPKKGDGRRKTEGARAISSSRLTSLASRLTSRVCLLTSRAGENLLRFCYAKEDADLEEACRRLVRR